MSIYDPDRVAHQVVRYHPLGIEVLFENDIVTIDEIIALEETVDSSDQVTCAGRLMNYYHLVYRTLAVHGICLAPAATKETRMLILYKLNLMLKDRDNEK